MSGQTLYIEKLARLSEVSQIERTFQKQDLYTRREITGQDIAGLLRELAGHFPSDISSSMAFDITAGVLETIDKEMIRLRRENLEAKLHDPKYIADLMNRNRYLQQGKMKPADVIWMAETIVRYLAHTFSR